MNPVCPTDCSQLLPPRANNPCAPNVKLSQIRRFFIGKANAAPLTDGSQAAEWITRISQNSNANNDVIRAYKNKGAKPAPKNNTQVIENGVTVQVNKSHTITYTAYDISDDNYEFMRNTECGQVLKLFGYETMGGVLFYNNDGQLVSIVEDDVLGDGDNDLEQISGSLTWNSQFSFQRVNASPIFGTDFDVPATGVLYDTIILNTADVTETEEGVTVTVPAVDSDLKFEFNKVDNRIGVATTMTVKVGSTIDATVDFPSDYLGAPFRFTDASAAVHTGVFASGVVTLT